MKKLLAYVQVYVSQVELYRPLGWLVMPISDACVNVAGLNTEGDRIAATTWRQVYSTISKELARFPWQPVYRKPFTIDGDNEVCMINVDKCIHGELRVTDFMVMDEREYYLRCAKREG